MREVATQGRRSITGLLALGIVLGVGYVIGCGGSGGGAVFASGATVVRHIATAPPKTASSPGVLIADVLSTTYSAPDPDDVLLRVSVRGTYTTTATSITLGLSVRNGAGTLVYFTESVTLPAGTNRGFLLSSAFGARNLFPGSGARDGSYQIHADISNGNPGGSTIDLGPAELEVITMNGVITMDPSPLL